MHGHARAATLERDECVLHGHVERHIARNDRDADHFDVGMLERHDERHHVVTRRVGVDPHPPFHAR